LKARKRKMAALHAGDLVLTKEEHRYLLDHPEDALAVIGVPGIILETYRDNFEVLIDWSLLSDDHDHRGRDRWCIDEIVKVGSLGKRSQFPAFTEGDIAALSDDALVVLLESAGEWMEEEWDPEEKQELTSIFQILLDEAKKRNLSYEIPTQAIIVGQFHERKIPAGQLQVGDLFTHEGKDYVVTGIQQNGYIRSKPIPSGTVRWFAPHYKVRLIKTAGAAVNIRNETRGVHHGQYDGVLTASDPETGEYRGHLDYAHLEEPGEEILIQWMEVPEEFRRQGIASQLVEKLKVENPGREINWGYTSEEGTAFREVFGEAVEFTPRLKGAVYGVRDRGYLAYVWDEQVWKPDAPIRYTVQVKGSGFEGWETIGTTNDLEEAKATAKGAILRTALLVRVAPAWVEDEEIWAKAKKEVDRSKYDSEDSYYAVVTTVYKNMGGKVKKKEAQAGMCYPDAFRFALGTEEGDLVHGTITNPDGAVMDHAWVEFPTGFVWEPESKSFFKTDAFYSGKTPVVHHRYTAEEASIMAVKTGHFGPWIGQVAQEGKARCPRCGEEAELGDLAPHKDERVTDMYEGNVCSTCRLRPWGWMLGEGRSLILKKRSSIEEIKETLEGNEIWTDQLSHGRDVVGVMDGKVWCQLPDTGLTDVTDQINWNKLMNEAMIQEFGPGWEERLQEEFRVEGQRELSEEERKHAYRDWLNLTDEWGSEEEHGTGPEYWREKYPFEEFLRDHLKALEELGIEGQIEAERIERRQRIFFRGGRTYIRTVTDIEEWALGLRGAVIIGGIKYRAYHYHGDIWTASWTRYREIEGLVPGVPEVKGQAGDVKLRQTVHKGGKKYIRTVTNIEFVERGDALKLRGVAIIDGIKYWVHHHHGDTWTGGNRIWDLKELTPGLHGSLVPGDWDPRDLEEATADMGETAWPYDGEKC